MSKARLLLISCTSFFIACSANSNPRDVEQALSDMGLTRSSDNARVYYRSVNGWTGINETSLVVNAGVSRHYLVELLSPCYGLDEAYSIRFTTPNLNLDAFGSIIVRSTWMGTERCRIERITPLLQAS